MMWTRQPLMLWWWETRWRRWRLEIRCVLPISPSKISMGRIANAPKDLPVAVIDEKSSAFFLGQAICHPKSRQRVTKASISGLHRVGDASFANAGDWIPILGITWAIRLALSSDKTARRCRRTSREQCHLLGLLNFHESFVYMVVSEVPMSLLAMFQGIKMMDKFMRTRTDMLVITHL